MTLDPAAPPASPETPPASGGVTPESTSPGAGQQNTAASQSVTAGHPLFVAHTQDELNAKFGSVREEGRLSAAKAAGFETLEQMNAAMSQYWQYVTTGALQPQEQPSSAAATPTPPATTPAQAQTATPPTTPPTTAQPQEAATTTATPPPATPAAAEDPAQELARIKQERQIEQAALAQGADPTKLSDVTSLLSGSLAAQAGADGLIPQANLDAVMSEFFTTRPFYKAAPRTVGGYSNPPAVQPKTTDQLINEANAKGDTATVIALQMSKLPGPPQAV